MPSNIMGRKFLPQNQLAPTNPPLPLITTSTAAQATAMISTIDELVTESLQQSSTANNIKILLDSKFIFYLGGSRAMFKRGADVKITESTDYDFYTTFTHEVEDFLIKAGFKSTTTSSAYFDSECLGIMKNGNIDIVLRKDAEFYKSVFDSIDPKMYVEHLWKGNPKCNCFKIRPLFNAMFKMLHDKQQKELESKQIDEMKRKHLDIVKREIFDIDDDEEEDIPF